MRYQMYNHNFTVVGINKVPEYTKNFETFFGKLEYPNFEKGFLVDNDIPIVPNEKEEMQPPVDETIYGKVIPEPDNPYDPKALKLELDGLHIGYIGKKEQPFVPDEVFKSGCRFVISGIEKPNNEFYMVRIKLVQ